MKKYIVMLALAIGACQKPVPPPPPTCANACANMYRIYKPDLDKFVEQSGRSPIAADEFIETCIEGCQKVATPAEVVCVTNAKVREDLRICTTDNRN